MERNGTERSVNFRLLTKSFDLGLGIPKSKFLGFRERYCMASGRRIRKKRDGIVRSVPFRSIPFRILVTTYGNALTVINFLDTLNNFLPSVNIDWLFCFWAREFLAAYM